MASHKAFPSASTAVVGCMRTRVVVRETTRDD